MRPNLRGALVEALVDRGDLCERSCLAYGVSIWNGTIQKFGELFGMIHRESAKQRVSDERLSSSLLMFAELHLFQPGGFDRAMTLDLNQI